MITTIITIIIIIIITIVTTTIIIIIIIIIITTATTTITIIFVIIFVIILTIYEGCGLICAWPAPRRFLPERPVAPPLSRCLKGKNISGWFLKEKCKFTCIRVAPSPPSPKCKANVPCIPTPFSPRPPQMQVQGVFEGWPAGRRPAD